MFYLLFGVTNVLIKFLLFLVVVKLMIVVVNQLLIVVFMLLCMQLMCVFDGFIFSDFEGPIASYVWMFGDGLTGIGSMLMYVFVLFGMYSVALMVIDG